jgi:hypothetical protein
MTDTAATSSSAQRMLGEIAWPTAFTAAAQLKAVAAEAESRTV